MCSCILPLANKHVQKSVHLNYNKTEFTHLTLHDTFTLVCSGFLDIYE